MAGCKRVAVEEDLEQQPDSGLAFSFVILALRHFPNVRLYVYNLTESSQEPTEIVIIIYLYLKIRN